VKLTKFFFFPAPIFNWEDRFFQVTNVFYSLKCLGLLPLDYLQPSIYYHRHRSRRHHHHSCVNVSCGAARHSIANNV